LIVAVLLLDFTSTAAEPLFWPARRDFAYPSIFNPWSIATGDLNGDQIVDTVAGGGGTILLGRSDGSLSLAASYPVGTQGVAVGDLDGDGILDIAASGSSVVTVLIGHGDGTFSIGSQISVAGDLWFLAIGEFNGDVNPDLAVANSSAGNITILLGTGGGTFSLAGSYPIEAPYSVSIADLDGDQAQDLVVCGGSLVSLIGHGDGTFEPPTVINTVDGGWSATVEDLNGDATPDIVSCTGAAHVAVFLGNGDGSFAIPIHVETGMGSRHAAIGDLTGDGVPDLAIANTWANNVSVHVGAGNGTFTLGGVFSSPSPMAVAIVDLGEGLPLDLEIASFGKVSVMHGVGDGTFVMPSLLPVGSAPQGIAAGDLNRDGAVDLVTTQRDNGQAAVMMGNGDGSFASAILHDVGQGAGALLLGDLNADLALDLVVANEVGDIDFPGYVTVRLGNATGSFLPRAAFQVSGRPTSIAAGDLNGDGILDLAVASSIDPRVQILRGLGNGTFASAQSFTAGNGMQDVAIALVDQDPHPDVVVRYPGAVGILRNLGNGNLGSSVVYPMGSFGTHLATGDLNGDGITDVAAPDQDASRVAVLVGIGDGTLAQPTYYSVARYPDDTVIADIDGDGRQDLVLTSLNTSGIGVLAGTVNGLLTTSQYYGGGVDPTCLVVAQLNADGRPDIAIACRYSNGVTLLFQNAAAAAVESAPPQTALASLHPSVPNPFRSSTTIQFSLTHRERARLELYSVDGRLVRRLLDQQFSAGQHQVGWDGRDESGRDVPSGTYIYRLQVNKRAAVRKVQVIR
jgi:hypothetical protein